MKGFMDRSKLAGTLKFTDAIFSVWHLLRRREGEKESSGGLEHRTVENVLYQIMENGRYNSLEKYIEVASQSRGLS